MIKKAFTLAEVLMVIGIIGVIAAVTIPNLNQNIDSEKNIALIRNTADQIEVGIGKHLASGGTIQESCGSKTGALKVVCIGDIIKNNLKSTKTCNSPISVSDCFAVSGIRSGQSCGYGFVLSNKVSACIGTNADRIFIDIDGAQNGINAYGADVFEFLISDDGVSFISSGGRKNRRNFARNQDETEWAMVVGNQDYLTCSGTLQWGVKEGCQ